MEVLIRTLNKNHIKEAIDLVWRVFSEFVAPDYCDEGVAEFKKTIAAENFAVKVKKGEFRLWGAFDNGKIVGAIAIREPIHITLLFVDKQYHRQGIARTLFKTALSAANISNKEFATVNSSPYALEAYKRLGFTPTDAEQTANGIRFIPMRYKIER